MSVDKQSHNTAAARSRVTIDRECLEALIQYMYACYFIVIG